MSTIEEFKKKYKISSRKEEEEEEKTSSSPIEEFKKKYGITTKDEADVLGSYNPADRKSKAGQVISSNLERMSTAKGLKGYEKYLEDEEAKKNGAQYDLNKDGKDSFWEKILGYLGGGGGVDTTLPTAGVTQTIHDLREDDSYARPNNDWSAKQKSKFGELYLTDPESAFAYASVTNKEINQLKEEREIAKIKENATESFGSGLGHTLGAIATAPLGLADYLGDLAYSNAGREIAPDGSVSPFEYSQAVTGGISSHLNEKYGTLDEDIPVIGGKGWGDVYGLGTSIAQSMASAYTLGGAGTLVSYFGQGAAAGVDDALARGASEGQAILYGAALGTFEGVAEMVGIDNLFKLGSASTVKGLVKNILKQSAAEGLEEGFTAITSEIADRLIMQDKSNFDLLVAELVAQGMSEADAKKKAWMSTIGDIAFDTIAGAVSGSVSGGIHSGVQTAITNSNAKKNYSGQALDIANEAAASDDANVKAVGVKYREKINDNKKLSGWNISELLEVTDNSKVKSAVEAQLTKLGESGDVSRLADVITKQAQGIELSKKEQALIDGSTYGQRVVNTLDRENIKSGEYDTKWAESIGTRRLNADVYNLSTDEKAVNEATKSNAVTENASTDVTIPTSESATGGDVTASKGDASQLVSKAKMIDTEGNNVDVNVAKIVDVEGGDASLELEDGKTVKASEVDFGDSGIGFVYNAAVEMVSGVGGFNVDAANLMVKGFNPSGTNEQAIAYTAGFNAAYRYGAMGYPVSELARGAETSKLTEKQRETAYNLGKAYGEGKVAEKQAKIVSMLSKNGENISKSAHKKGKVYFDGSAVGKSLSERQKASLKGLRVIAEGMGVNIHIFESKVVDGKRQGANGWYDPVKKEIHLDLHAGVDGNGLMLYTASHELTHHIREVAPAKFKVVGDALLEEYTKRDVSLDELVANKIEQLERNGRITESMTEEQIHDLAYEEVVADSCEAMLVDSNALEALSRKLNEKDKSLWETIKNFIAKLVARIKAAYEGVDPDSAEGKAVREMEVSVERLQKLWVDALLEASDMVDIDTSSESVAPMLSERTWTESEYVTHRDQMAEKIAKALDVSVEKAKAYIDDINSIARMIADDRVRLDYEASSFGSAFVSNVEYGGSFDYTTLCKKRRIYTGTFTEIQKRLNDVALSPDDILTIRNLMIEEGIEATCGLCYVEGSRANMGKFAKEFIRLYKRDNPLAWIPNMADVNTPDGVEQMRISHPEAYEQYVYFWNHYGKLKDSDPALFASQQKPKLYEARKEYKGEILEHFKGDSTVAKKNLNGGIRMQSFSDFEIVHLIDTMQVIMDMSTVGLAGQAYTKVPEFAKAFGNTGLKINLSLIAKGVDADGNLIFDDREGMPHETAFELRDKHSKNVGTIIVTFTDEQLLAAMADPRIDFIIPFHRSQWKKGQYGAMGLPKGTKDYTFMQNEKLIKKTYHEYRGRMVLDKASNYMPNEYWDFSKSGKENAEGYLKMCAENNKRPKFYKLLDYDGKGTYSLKADGSTDGYWKLLIDFKMYDNDGIGSPQEAVTPTFNMDEAKTMLDEYQGGHSKYPVASSVVDKFVEGYNKEHRTKYSDRNPYSYEAITSKPDMKLTTVGGNVPTNRADIVAAAKKNAAKVGNFNPKDGSVSVRVEDIGVDVILGKDGLKHSLDRRMSENAPVVVKAGEILRNSIRINELNPRKAEIDESYVLIGAAKDANGELYIVRSVVNRLSNELTTMDVLYAINAKKENRMRSMRPRFQHLVTDSTISIAQLLDFVNSYFPDILPESVLRHYGYTERPSGNLGESALYQDRNPDSYSNRSLLANALETAAQNDIERQKLSLYKQKIDLINSEEQKLLELRTKIKELSFAKGKRDTEAIKKLQFEANQAANRINTYDKQLLNLESTKALRGVLEREKALARKRDAQKYKEAVDRYREKAARTQRELMDRYQESRKKATEGRNKTAMRYKIKGIVSELNTLLLKPTAKKHIKEELRKEVADALSAINMDTIGADERVAMYNDLIAKEKNPDVIAELTKTRDRIQLQGDNLKEKLNNLQSAYEKIKNTDDIELNLAYQEVIQNSIKAVSEKIGNTSIRNMTLEQLEAVYDLFSMIRKTVRDANKSFKEKKGQTIMQMAEAVNDQVRTVGGQPYKRNVISASLQRMGWTFLKPFVAFRTIGSVTLTNMYNELRNGEDTFYGDVRDAQEFIEEQKKKHGYKSWDMKKTKTFTAKSGKTFDLTLEQMMSMYAYFQREQAHDHIIEGGIVLENSLITEKNKWGVPIKYEVTTKDAFNLSEETFREICDYLQKEHKEAAAFVKEMQAYLSDTMGAKGNEVSMQLLGVKLFKEKFYLPIKSSQYYMNFKAEEAGEVKLKSPAFSKETVQHANNPIVIHNFTDLWAEHINDMSMYHSFVLALEDFTRVYNYKTKTDAKVETMDTKATLETAYPGVTKYINKFLKDMNGGVRGETVGWAEKLTSLSKKGAVLGSASVTIQQPSAVMRAMAYISPKYFVTSAYKSINLLKHKQDFAELKKYAPIAGIKEMGRFDVGMGQGTVDWIKSDKTVLDKAEDILSMPPAFMDEVTWVSIWNAVKRETVHKNPKISTSSEEFLELCGERFTEVISLSQVYDSVFSRSDIMRNKSWIAKSLTAFMAEPTTTLNMIWDSWVQAKRSGTVKGFVKATASVGSSIVAATVFNAVLKSIISAMRDDDDDESYIEKYLEHLAGELKDNLNPLTLIPYGKDIVSIFQGYDVERMDMTLFSNFAEAWDAMDSDSKTLYEKWSGLVGAISAFFGVPVKNVERDVRGLITTIFGETEETTLEGMLNAIEEGWTGEEKSNGQQLYEAMLKGDSAQIKRIEGRFEDQSKIDTAIRKALRENDPRIKEAALARYNGDIAEYMKIAKSIIAEGNFKQDDIVAAINSEVNALKPGETSTPSDKAVSLYKVEDYYAALEGGNSSVANTVKEDIIATEVANGKDRGEAETSFYSKFVNHIRDLYDDGEITDYNAKEMLVRYGDKTSDEAASKVQYWNFKKQYPDYDLSESAVSKYYSDVKPSGISVEVYYDYYQRRSKAEGVDLNGDGKTDSGSVKTEVMRIINSLPISSYQKDTLYYLNGWSKNTIYEAPWH